MEAGSNSESEKQTSGAQTDVVAIDFGDALDITSVRETWERLKETSAAKSTVVLNAEEVTHADTAALQMLSSFFQDARGQGQNVSWKNTSDALVRSAKLIDVDSLLGFTDGNM